MGEIVEFPKPQIPHVMIDCGDEVMIISVASIKGIADGKMSIAEFEKPEDIARILATMLMSYIDGAN